MLIICAAKDIEQIISAHRAEDTPVSAVLSFEHPGATTGRGKAPRLHDPQIDQSILTFWDIEDADAQDGPSLDIVKQSLSFLDKHRKDLTIVHCNAGKSRSVAIALAFLTKDHDIATAINIIKDMRPVAAPNIAVIQIADSYLGLGGALLDAVKKDPLFSENREAAEKSRARYLEKNPDLAQKLYPEKQSPKP